MKTKTKRQNKYPRYYAVPRKMREGALLYRVTEAGMRPEFVCLGWSISGDFMTERRLQAAGDRVSLRTAKKMEPEARLWV